MLFSNDIFVSINSGKTEVPQNVSNKPFVKLVCFHCICRIKPIKGKLKNLLKKSKHVILKYKY